MITKQIISRGLGAFWVIDGLLQLQPKMFGADFVSDVLTPNLDGQPAFLHAIVAFAIHVFTFNTVLSNTMAAILQLAIGVMLFFSEKSRMFRAGLCLSIVWGLMVWAFGEGLGGLLTGSASFYTGAPGAALAYVLMSVLLLKREPLTAYAWAKAAGWTLVFGAALQLQPMFWTPDGLQMLNLPDAWAAHAAAANLLLFLVPAALGMALIRKANRFFASATIIFLLLVWWLGQDFGGLLTVWHGTATDPNTAPLLALMIIPMILVQREPIGTKKRSFEERK